MLSPSASTARLVLLALGAIVVIALLSLPFQKGGSRASRLMTIIGLGAFLAVIVYAVTVGG